MCFIRQEEEVVNEFQVKERKCVRKCVESVFNRSKNNDDDDKHNNNNNNDRNITIKYNKKKVRQKQKVNKF